MPNKRQRSVKELVAAAKLREATVVLCFAGDLQGRAEELQQQLAEVSTDWAAGSLADVDPRAAIAEELAAVRAELEAERAEFLIRALPSRQWSDLLARHPAKDSAGVFDVETFPQAAIVACCADPAMTADEYAELSQVLTGAQEAELFDAVWRVNTQTQVPFSLGSSAILASLTAGS